MAFHPWSTLVAFLFQNKCCFPVGELLQLWVVVDMSFIFKKELLKRWTSSILEWIIITIIIVVINKIFTVSVMKYSLNAFAIINK